MSKSGPSLTMKSQRPYMLRALYEWIVDSGGTPHLLVDANFPGVLVPPFAVRDGRVVLNVAPRAVRDFAIGENRVSFECRFGGRSTAVEVPPDAVLAIYAQENGAGMAFEAASRSAPATLSSVETDRLDDDPDDPPPGGTPSGGERGGHLKVVK